MTKYILLILISMTILFPQTDFKLANSIKSLAIPGLGESSIGEQKSAKTFFITEASIWFIYFVSKKSSDWYQKDYLAFASLHADAIMADKDYLFAVNIGHYSSLDDYNDTKERQRLVKDKYDENSGYGWSWDSLENRIKYDEIRMKSVIHNKYAKFALGGLVLNRLISFFDVIYLERSKVNISAKSSFFEYNDIIKVNFSLDIY